MLLYGLIGDALECFRGFATVAGARGVGLSCASLAGADDAIERKTHV